VQGVRVGQSKTDHEDCLTPGGLGRGSVKRGRGRMGSCTMGRCQAGRYMQEAWPVMGNLVGDGGERSTGGGRGKRSPGGGEEEPGGEGGNIEVQSCTPYLPSAAPQALRIAQVHHHPSYLHTLWPTASASLHWPASETPWHAWRSTHFGCHHRP